MELTVRTSHAGERAVLGLGGEIDVATLPRLHNAVVRLVHENLGETVVVDLDGVIVCDDAGLGVLLGGAGRAREAGGELVVVCSAGPLRQRLARTGFDRAVQVVSTISAVSLA